MPAIRTQLETGEVHHHGLTYAVYVERVLARIAARQGYDLPRPAAVETSLIGAVQAFVVKGQVLAQCPDCGIEYQLVFTGEPLFMCSVCWNRVLGGLYRRVVLPEEFGKVEAAMIEVRDTNRLNWIPPGSKLVGIMRGEPEQAVAEIVVEMGVRVREEGQ